MYSIETNKFQHVKCYMLHVSMGKERSLHVCALVISGICVLVGRLFASTKSHFHKVVFTRGQRTERPGAPLKWNQRARQSWRGANQRSKRMAHILLVNKKNNPLMKRHFITSLGGYSRLNPRNKPP